MNALIIDRITQGKKVKIACQKRKNLKVFDISLMILFLLLSLSSFICHPTDPFQVSDSKLTRKYNKFIQLKLDAKNEHLNSLKNAAKYEVYIGHHRYLALQHQEKVDQLRLKLSHLLSKSTKAIEYSDFNAIKEWDIKRGLPFMDPIPTIKTDQKTDQKKKFSMYKLEKEQMERNPALKAKHDYEQKMLIHKATRRPLRKMHPRERTENRISSYYDKLMTLTSDAAYKQRQKADSSKDFLKQESHLRAADAHHNVVGKLWMERNQKQYQNHVRYSEDNFFDEWDHKNGLGKYRSDLMQPTMTIQKGVEMGAQMIDDTIQS